MSKQHLQQINHNYLRYANCWEDADILLKGLAPEEGSRILSIGSAGDNSFSLLTTNPEEVVAVDVNEVQLQLITLKKAAFATLTYDQWLEFLGFSPCEDRLTYWPKVAVELTEQAFNYWNANLPIIRSGVIHHGKFERYFRLFRTRILPLVQSKEKIQQLQQNRNEELQASFYNKKWNTPRWRLFLRLFFSKLIMGKCGRDPAFMKEVDIPVNKFIMKKAEQHLKSSRSQQNYFLSYIMKGVFAEGLPHYARPENFQLIKENLHKLTLKKAYAEEGNLTAKGFTHMNLSNIFEYMNLPTFNNSVQALLKGSPQVEKIAYWNLMVPRSLAAITNKFQSNDSLSTALTNEDKGFFYNKFNLDTRL